MGTTTISPILPFELGLSLQGLQYGLSSFSRTLLLISVNLKRWLVATTTIWSGFSYMFGENAFRIVAQTKKTDRL